MIRQLAVTAIVLTLAGGIFSLPGQAQTTFDRTRLLTQQTLNAPQIDSFTVNSVNQLTPGTELVFTLQGTPSANATFTVGNFVRNVPMQEVQPGVYEGRYTIRSQDQITNTIPIRANLQQGDRVASVRLQDPLISTTATNSNVGANTSGTNNNTTQAPYISRFTAESIQRPAAGSGLNFTLVGTPGARATFSIAGIAYNLPMQEVSSGTYQGRYVIRRQDYFPPEGVTVTANLQSGNEVARAQLEQNLFANNGTNSTSTTSTSQLPLEILSPQNNSRVNGTVEIRGRSTPNSTVNVNVKATTSLAGIVGFDRNVLEQTVNTDAQGNFRFTFSPTISIRGTRYDVSLSTTNGGQTDEESLILYQQ
jgi:hypothetical protein